MSLFNIGNGVPAPVCVHCGHEAHLLDCVERGCLCPHSTTVQNVNAPAAQREQATPPAPESFDWKWAERVLSCECIDSIPGTQVCDKCQLLQAIRRLVAARDAHAGEQVAAALKAAADIPKLWADSDPCGCEENFGAPCTHNIMGAEVERRIRALISPNAHAQLERVKAQVRLEEANYWYKEYVWPWRADDQDADDRAKERLASLADQSSGTKEAK